jgi:arsenate reductase (glutaredoxin)
MIEFYGYDKCDTCRRAKKWLDGRGVKYRWVGIVQRPPSVELLKKILAGGDYGLKQIFNTSGQVYRELKVKDRIVSMSVDEAVALLSEHGKLCKRPIVSDGSRHTVGFKDEVFEAVWGGG